MKHNHYITKITAMLMVIVIFASLTVGCGVKNPDTMQEPTPPTNVPSASAQPTPTEPSDPTEPTQPSEPTEPTQPEIDPVIAPLIGTWILGQQDANYEEKTFTLNADGTCYYNDEYCTWEGDEDSVVIRYGRYGMTIFSRRDLEDGTAYLFTSGSYGYNSIDYYFQEDYLAKFDKVTLTPENITEYMEVINWQEYTTTDMGRLKEVYQCYAIRFKEGLGMASWCIGYMNFQSTSYHITYTRTPGEEVMGDMISTNTITNSKETVLAPNDNYWYFYRWCNLDYETEYKTTISIRELVGASDIIGVVYVPKN